MAVIDAQVHVWRADSLERPWPSYGASYAHRGGGEFLDIDVLAAMDGAGVHRALLVSPTFEGCRNDLVLEAAERRPARLAAVMRCDLADPATADFGAWAADPRVAAARAVFAMSNAGAFADGSADWFFAGAAEAGLPVLLYAPYGTDHIREVARRHPELRIGLGHLNLDIALRDDEVNAEVDAMLELAELPNIAALATCLPSYSTEDYPYPRLRAQVARVVEAFGPQRVFWGSDLSRLPGTYSDLVRLFRDDMPFLSPADANEVLGDALLRWLGADRPALLRAWSGREPGPISSDL